MPTDSRTDLKIMVFFFNEIFYIKKNKWIKDKCNINEPYKIMLNENAHINRYNMIPFI